MRKKWTASHFLALSQVKQFEHNRRLTIVKSMAVTSKFEISEALRIIFNLL